MANSIRGILNANDTISEIKLLLGTKSSVCIVVEGINDQKLFEPLFTENTTLVQSYSGKNDILTIIRRFPRNKRVIGIRDRDYSNKTQSTRLFYCDYSCAEMMIIALDECFYRTYCNFYEDQSLSFKDLRLYCLEHLEQLSKIRKMNEQKKWSINFDTVKVPNIYNDNISKMNENILNQICLCKINKITRKQLQKCNVLRKCISVTDYLNITNGHDFIEMLRIMCKRKNHSPGREEIASNIRATFGIHEFRKTNLYSSLVDYQTRKKLVIVN